MQFAHGESVSKLSLSLFISRFVTQTLIRLILEQNCRKMERFLLASFWVVPPNHASEGPIRWFFVAFLEIPRSLYIEIGIALRWELIRHQKTSDIYSAWNNAILLFIHYFVPFFLARILHRLGLSCVSNDTYRLLIVLESVKGRWKPFFNRSISGIRPILTS